MVTDRYTLEVIAKEKGLNQLNAKLDRVSKRMKSTQSARVYRKSVDDISKLNGQIEKQSEAVKKARVQTSKLGRAWERSKMGVLGFNGALLSTLFFGMELQRIFGGALKAIFDGYGKIMGEGSLFNKQMTKLNAAWQFFKFQLADALASSKVFTTFIKFAIDLLNWFGQLPAPIRTIISSLLVVGAVLGSLLFLTGVWGLGIAGLVDGMAALGITTNGVRASFAGLFESPLMGLLLLIGVLAAATVKMTDFHDSSEMGRKAGEKLSDTWKATINSVLGPLGDALGIANLRLKDMSEWGVIVGVTMHNFFTILGILGDTIVALARTVINFIQIALSPFISNIKTAAEAISKFLAGDFDGALDAAKSAFSNFSNNFMKQVDDMKNTWGTFGTNVSDKFNNLQGYSQALDAFRNEQEALNLSSRTTQETMNIQPSGLAAGNQNINQQTTIYIGGEEGLAGTEGINQEVQRYLQESGLTDLQSRYGTGYTQ